jgi:ribosomal protein S18 acetylase RimI-like enzyme
VGQRELPPPAHDHPSGDEGLSWAGTPPGIAALERAAAEHWQATDTAQLGSWLLRADGGFTGRANSALPLGDPGLPLAGAVDEVEAWYRARGLPPMIVIPGPLGAAAPEGGLAGDPLDTLLATRGWRVRSAPAVVMMTADAGRVGGTGRSVGGPPGPEVSGAALAVRFAAQPDETWLASYHYRGEELPARAVRLLLSAPWQAFASLAVDGETAAVGRVSVGAGWAGITAVDVDPRYRRRGLGTLMTRALAGEAARQRARRVFLQVEEDNLAARALYARCGFAGVHRYHYRVAPAAVTG